MGKRKVISEEELKPMTLPETTDITGIAEEPGWMAERKGVSKDLISARYTTRSNSTNRGLRIHACTTNSFGYHRPP